MRAVHRCPVAGCNAPAMVEIVALWAMDDGEGWRGGDTCTVLTYGCDDDRSGLLSRWRRSVRETGAMDPEGLLRQPLGVYVREV